LKSPLPERQKNACVISAAEEPAQLGRYHFAAGVDAVLLDRAHRGLPGVVISLLPKTANDAIDVRSVHPGDEIDDAPQFIARGDELDDVAFRLRGGRRSNPRLWGSVVPDKRETAFLRLPGYAGEGIS
jgi:hypothetical protein